MRTLISRRDIQGIISTFEKAKSVFGDDKTIWTIYLQALAQTRSIGDPFAMAKASEAYNLFPENKDIFTLYRWLTYGQDRVNRAAQASVKANELYNNGNYLEASLQFAEAMDLDPLESGYGLNAGLSNFQRNDYKTAINYFNIVITNILLNKYLINILKSKREIHWKMVGN